MLLFSLTFQASPAVAHQHLLELAEEVIRLRALLLAGGKTTDVSETLRMERLAQLEEENVRLQRLVAHLTARVHDLERAQTEAEFTAEVDEERYFNMHLAESPHHPASLPVAISPHVSRRTTLVRGREVMGVVGSRCVCLTFA